MINMNNSEHLHFSSRLLGARFRPLFVEFIDLCFDETRAQRMPMCRQITKRKTFSSSAVLLSLVFFIAVGLSTTKAAKCQKIKIPMCLNIGYNMTHMPNFLTQESQDEATIKVHEFQPLVAVQCYPHLLFFLCSVFAPMCSTEINEPIYACRSMCEAAKKGCQPVMQKFGFDWPDTLDCKRLPKEGDSRSRSDPKRLCMSAPNSETPGVNSSEILKKLLNDNVALQKYLQSLGKTGPWPGQTPTVQPSRGLNLSLYNWQNCLYNKKFVYLKKFNFCAAKCGEHALFTANDKEFTQVWISVWAILCFILTAVTVLTFAIDTHRFKYPERPIIFLSLCYNLYSVGYIIRIIAGRNTIVCESSKNHLVVDGMNTAGCTMVFLMLYYFGMASAVWWVILTVTWFLAAGMKWGQEAIESKASYFHLVSWSVPAIQTIIVLIMRKVDGDELSGLCYVGNQSPSSLSAYVLAPLCVYLVVGSLFLLAGFVALFRIRNVLKSKETNTEKLEKLMVRIGVFSVLYTVPATCVVACYFYEHKNMRSWQVRSVMCQENVKCPAPLGPKVEVFMVKYFMLLIVGISSNMWIWSSKTFQSWRDFYHRTVLKKPVPSKLKNSMGPQPVFASGRQNPHSRTLLQAPNINSQVPPNSPSISQNTMIQSKASGMAVATV